MLKTPAALALETIFPSTLAERPFTIVLINPDGTASAIALPDAFVVAVIRAMNEADLIFEIYPIAGRDAATVLASNLTGSSVRLDKPRLAAVPLDEASIAGDLLMVLDMRDKTVRFIERPLSLDEALDPDQATLVITYDDLRPLAAHMGSLYSWESSGYR